MHCGCFFNERLIKRYKTKELLIEAIKYTVDHLHKLIQIVVYDVSITDSIITDLFKYARSKGIEVSIPNNLLKMRNIILGGKLNG